MFEAGNGLGLLLDTITLRNGVRQEPREQQAKLEIPRGKKPTRSPKGCSKMGAWGGIFALHSRSRMHPILRKRH